MRVLIIEDDAKTAGFMVSGFREAGFTAEVARDGEEGLAFAESGTFDVATVDLMLPKLDGVSLIRRLRREGNALPVIVVSAKGTVDERIAGLNAGGDDYMAKPFSISELIARAQALLRRASGNVGGSSLRAGDIVLDIVSRRVTRGGRRIDLQPLEMQLLEYLMINRGRVVSKTTIMERVWDYDFDPHTNVVESRICHLREKLGTKADGKPIIRTVRGFGYVFEG